MRTCVYCFGPLPMPRNAKRRYCSNACRQAAYRRRPRPLSDLDLAILDLPVVKVDPESVQERKNGHKARTLAEILSNTPLRASESVSKAENRNGVSSSIGEEARELANAAREVQSGVEGGELT